MMHAHARRWFRHGRGHGPGRHFRDMMWGAGAEGAWGAWRERGRKLRRGEVKYVILETLAESPKHGYEIITALEAKRNIRPSAGSVYPTLQMLEDGGFVTSEHIDGKRVYTISDAGRTMLAERAGADEDDDEDDSATHAHGRLREAARKLALAVMSGHHASDETVEQICDVLKDARKQIYDLLSDDEG